MQSPGSSVTSLNALTPLVLVGQLGDVGTQTVKVTDHENKGRKWGFMDFLKKKKKDLGPLGSLQDTPTGLPTERVLQNSAVHYRIPEGTELYNIDLCLRYFFV